MGGMDKRLRMLLPGQFGLVTLFTWTTLAAVFFAIFRLSLLPELKLICVVVVWGTFELAHRIVVKPVTPAARINVAILDLLGRLILPAFFIWRAFTSGLGRLTVGYMLIGLFTLISIYSIVRTIFVIRSELRLASNAGVQTLDSSSSQAMVESMKRMIAPLNKDDKTKLSKAIANEISKVNILKRYFQPHYALKAFHGKTAQDIITMSGN